MPLPRIALQQLGLPIAAQTRRGVSQKIATTPWAAMAPSVATNPVARPRRLAAADSRALRETRGNLAAAAKGMAVVAATADAMVVATAAAIAVAGKEASKQ